MTLKANFPAGIRYYVRTYEAPGIPQQGWHLETEACRQVVRNWENIPKYLALGHLAELETRDDCYV